MARRPASRKPSPVMAAITVANFVKYSIRLYTHSRKKDSSDHRMAAASPFLVFCRALPCAQIQSSAVHHCMLIKILCGTKLQLSAWKTDIISAADEECCCRCLWASLEMTVDVNAVRLTAAPDL